jgi:flagellar L-ring protein precursor FlgH
MPITYSGFAQALLKPRDVIGKCLIAVLALAATACAVAPDTIVKTPLTAKPLPLVKPAASSGAIFQAVAYKPLFEDRRARMVGDTLTINISENTTAAKAGDGSSSKTGSVDSSLTPPIGLPISIRAMSLAANSSVKNEDKSAVNSSNNFNGTIGVTVIEVLENGNLVVSGEKQIALDHGTEFVRFSGVVNPDSITLGNNVPSSKVADARIEYRSNSRIDAAQIMTILARFFLSFIPI